MTWDPHTWWTGFYVFCNLLFYLYCKLPWAPQGRKAISVWIWQTGNWATDVCLGHMHLQKRCETLNNSCLNSKDSVTMYGYFSMVLFIVYGPILLQFIPMNFYAFSIFVFFFLCLFALWFLWNHFYSRFCLEASFGLPFSLCIMFLLVFFLSYLL